MMTVTLDRVGDDNEQTYGVLGIGGRPRFVTCEDLWRKNQRRLSCIPIGRYLCLIHDSPHFGRTYRIVDVPNRSDILFHSGNNNADTEGCILVGSSFNPEPGGSGIINSRLAFGKFIAFLKEVPEFTLIVRDLSRTLPISGDWVI